MSKRVDSSKDISILAGLARTHTGDGGAQAPLDDIEVAQRIGCPVIVINKVM